MFAWGFSHIKCFLIQLVKLEAMAQNRRVYTFEVKERFVNALLQWRLDNNFAQQLGESSIKNDNFSAINEKAFGVSFKFGSERFARLLLTNGLVDNLLAEIIQLY